MTHIARIELRNWARYAGVVAVDLGPEVYAIEAQWEGDVARSNWGGKTKLVEAVPFAFYGWHRDKGQGAGADDLVITHGTDEGGVVITLSTGHVVERMKQRGKPARLKVHTPGQDKPAVGDAAQALVEQLVGLGQKDFFSTCFVRQKHIAKFVTGDAGERQELITEWCQLRPLERAAKRASDALSAAVQKREKAVMRADTLAEVIGRYLPGTYGELQASTVEDLAGVGAKLRELLGERQGRVDVLRRRREDGIAWDAKARAMVDQTALTAEIAQAREEATIARTAVPAMPDLAPLFADHQAATADLRTKSVLAAGKFDGVCPVGSCACPITKELNDARTSNAAARARAEKREQEARKALGAGQAQESAARTAERVAERAEARLRALEEQAARAKAEKLHGVRPEPVDPAELARAEALVADARTALSRAEEAQRQVLAVLRDIDRAREEAAQLAAEVAELRGAAVALGRSGAQRVIGAAMVGAVERAANGEMSSAGIGLVVRVPWEREGGKLTPECEACGAPIKGEAMKECPRCEAPRGKAMVQGPFVTLSDRSGAAEDLAGLTLQLSAASWLRRKRSIAWSSAVLDEPFGALDEANRSSVAAHLIAMLRGRHGFSQSFVIAHHRGVLDAMPARIIVRAGVKGSTLEVVR